MNAPISREPTIIADILPDNKIEWHINPFLNVLKRANGRFIRLIIMIGGYQKGKTSFIALTTGNKKHVIGNGEQEQTVGAMIDGPYSIHELARRWKATKYYNIANDEAIFFIDIEGYGCFNRGEIENQIKAFYSKLCAPFIAISSNIIFISEKNESSMSITQIISALKFGDFVINNFDIDKKFNTSFELMTLVLNIDAINGINYSNPTLKQYNNITQYLTDQWQIKRFHVTNCKISSKPFPKFDGQKDIFHQKEPFYNGFKYVISDFLHNIIHSNSRIKTKNPEIICNFFSQITRIDPFDSVSLKNANRDFFTQSVCDNIQNIYDERMNQEIDPIFREYLESQREYSLRDTIVLDRREILNILKGQSFEKFDSILHAQMLKEYFQIPEVKSKIDQIKVNIVSTINNRLSTLINDIKEMIISKANDIKSFIMIEVDKEYKRKRKTVKDEKILQYINTDEEELFDIFNSDLLPMANNMINNKINPIYFNQITELNEMRNNIPREIKNIINLKLTSFVIKMRNKKKLQTLAKVGIGVAVGVAGVALIGTGIGVAAGAAIASTGTAAAGTGAAAAVAGTSAATGVALAAVTAGTSAAAGTASMGAMAAGAAIGASVGAGVGAVTGGVVGGIIEPRKKT